MEALFYYSLDFISIFLKTIPALERRLKKKRKLTFLLRLGPYTEMNSKLSFWF